MIIIINGSLGVGKCSTPEEQHWKFDKSVSLDEDAIGNVKPFEIYDNTPKEREVYVQTFTGSYLSPKIST